MLYKCRIIKVFIEEQSAEWRWSRRVCPSSQAGGAVRSAESEPIRTFRSNKGLILSKCVRKEFRRKGQAAGALRRWESGITWSTGDKGITGYCGETKMSTNKSRGLQILWAIIWLATGEQQSDTTERVSVVLSFLGGKKKFSFSKQANQITFFFFHFFSHNQRLFPLKQHSFAQHTPIEVLILIKTVFQVSV